MPLFLKFSVTDCDSFKSLTLKTVTMTFVFVPIDGKRPSSSIARIVLSNPMANPTPGTRFFENRETKLSNLSPPANDPPWNFSSIISQIVPVEYENERASVGEKR